MTEQPSLPAIVMVLGEFAPIGGVEPFTHALVMALPETAGRVSVASWGRSLRELPLLREIAGHGVRLFHLTFRWGCRWNIPDLLLLPFARRMARKADVLIFTKAMDLRVHRAIRALKSVRSPGTSLLVVSYRPSEYWGSPPVELFECMDCIAVQASSFADDLRQMGYGGRIDVIPYIPPAPPSLPLAISRDSGPVRLGFLGRFEGQKNLPYLLDIFQATRGLGSFELHLYGRGSQQSWLEQQIVSRGLQNEIFLHGFVQDQEKWKVIDSCDLFLNPSLSEGQCLVALEVLSRGRPIAATAVGAMPDILQHKEFGALLPANDAQSAAGIIAELALSVRRNPGSTVEIASRYAAVFDREAIARQYVALIADLANKKKDISVGQAGV
jgi:glycosyltransferase involved in cell wall biosynthesis